MSWIDVLVSFLPVLLHLVCTFILVFVAHRQKCQKSILECLAKDVPEIFEKELENMYSTLKERQDNPAAFKQTFTEYEPDYVYNPDTKHLEPLPDKNVQQYIQSYIECALERALERFMPKNVVNAEDTVEDYGEAVQDLGALGEAMEIAEEYREKLGLPDNYSMAQIYSAVDERAKKIKASLEASRSPKNEEVKKDDEKKA